MVRDARTQDLYAKTIGIMNRMGHGVVLIDSTGGYGAGLADMMYEAGYSPYEINFGEKAENEEKFYNKRSEMYWDMAQWVKRGGSLPRCEELKKELISPLMGFDEKGKLRLESKEQIRKRLKMSPDHADALALTFAVPDSAVMEVIEDDFDDRPLTTDELYGYGGDREYREY